MVISVAASGNAATLPNTDIAGAAANANQINWAIDPENLLHETQPTAPAAKGVNSPLARQADGGMPSMQGSVP
jgi:hypothetical protein